MNSVKIFKIKMREKIGRSSEFKFPQKKKKKLWVQIIAPEKCYKILKICYKLMRYIHLSNTHILVKQNYKLIKSVRN